MLLALGIFTTEGIYIIIIIIINKQIQTIKPGQIRQEEVYLK